MAPQQTKPVMTSKDPGNCIPTFLTLSEEEIGKRYKLINKCLFPGGVPPEAQTFLSNDPRNRYRNIGPYDHNRYRLPASRGGNDYVNASKIELMQSDGVTRTWIAAQMPFQSIEETKTQCIGESVGAFWGMIEGLGRETNAEMQKRGTEDDENEVRIVMLVPEVEMCRLYFSAEEIPGNKGSKPEEGRLITMGAVEMMETQPEEEIVKLTESFYNVPKVNAAFEFQPKGATHDKDLKVDIREIDLRTYAPHEGPSPCEARLESITKVKHINYRSWKDFDIPNAEDTLPLVKLLRRARQGSPGVAYASDPNSGDLDIQSSKPKFAPLVVHCRAGIGRTGTYIALDFLLSEMDRGAYDDCLRGEEGPWPMWFQKKHLGPQRQKVQDEVDGDAVLEAVRQIRRQRVGSVQTTEQFGFIYGILKQQWTERVNRLQEEYVRQINAPKSSDGKRVGGSSDV